MANPGGMIAGVQIPMFNGGGNGSPGTSSGTLEFPGGMIITITGRKLVLHVSKFHEMNFIIVHLRNPL